MSMENPENIKNFGIKKFSDNEYARWTCPAGAICVHKYYRYGCGRKLTH